MADRTGGYRGDAERLLRRRLDRADFLRLIGAGATLPFVPASVAALGARPSNAQSTPTPAELLAQMVAGGEFPIGVWWSPPPGETNAIRYGQIIDGGFNFVIGGNGVTNESAIREALDAAREASAAKNRPLKFLLTDDPGPRDGPGLQDLIKGADTRSAGAQDAEPGIMQYMNEQDDPASAPDGTVSGLALSDVQQRIRERVGVLLGRYSEYPALAGINLYDEPRTNMFKRLKFAKSEVRGQFPDTGDLPYANVYPSYTARSALGARTYGEYLDLYLKSVRPPLLSFDHYPLLSRGEITDDYFYNWGAIRNRALKYHIPSWVFIQSVDFRGNVISPPRRGPNKDELYWQVNVSLAYGAKGIQYFTYWTPEDYLENGWELRYGEALINRDTGEPTQTYHRASEVNEYLRVIGRELLPLTSEAVTHAGVKKARPGVEPFKANNYVKAVSGDPVILGKFRRTKEEPQRYFLVVNRSLSNPSSTRLTVPGSVTEVWRLRTGTDPGTYAPVTLEVTPSRGFKVELEAGEAELYRIRISG